MERFFTPGYHLRPTVSTPTPKRGRPKIEAAKVDGQRWRQKPYHPLSPEDEMRRALRSWWRFDQKLNLACFRPLEELQDWVKDPEAFRKNVRNMVIYMNAPVYMWLKVKPGKQVFSEFETRKGKCERNLGRLSDGMTLLRGEAAKEEVKIRITIEREQRCYGFCDDTTEPRFVPGTTSVTFTGAHFRMSNVKWPEEVWLNTEVFYANGKQVVHEAGKPVPEGLAMSLRSIRREAPEFWDLLEKLDFQF